MDGYLSTGWQIAPKAQVCGLQKQSTAGNRGQTILHPDLPEDQRAAGSAWSTVRDGSAESKPMDSLFAECPESDAELRGDAARA